MTSTPELPRLAELATLSEYLKAYGPHLASRAIHSLSPLHVPGRDQLPDFSGYPENRMPMSAQQHVAAGAGKMLDAHRAGFLIGELGVGKSITALATVHEHAKLRYGGQYRAIVLCPDHLISKWIENEIKPTLPSAAVHGIDKWFDVLRFAANSTTVVKLRRSKPDSTKPRTCWVSIAPEPTHRVSMADVPTAILVEERAPEFVEHRSKRWTKNGVEWLVVGRDQIKRECGRNGLGSMRPCFDGKDRMGQPSRCGISRRENPAINPDGSYKRDARGRVVYQSDKIRNVCCPKCGHVPKDKGIPVTTKQMGDQELRCEGLVLREIRIDTDKFNGRDALYEATNTVQENCSVPNYIKSMKPGQVVSHAGKQWRIEFCDEPLYQSVRDRNWWPAAKLMQKRMRRWAKYLIVDEAHEQKSDESAQSMAMGKILGITEYCIAMTGTFIGGYANHLFPLLMRLAAGEMRRRGFEWGQQKPFIQKYGCYDYITTGTVAVGAGSKSIKGTGAKSMRKAKIGQTQTRDKVRPGIMPTLFTQLIMHRAMFLRLHQFVDHLPRLDKSMVPVELPEEIMAEYCRVEATLKKTCEEMIAGGNMKLLGTMLWTLLAYPDFPFDWNPHFPGKESVGWWHIKDVYTPENYEGVVSPFNFGESIALPKEEKIVELCKQYVGMGDQVWIFTLLAEKHSPVQRWIKALEDIGLRVGHLKSDDATPREREAYINKLGRHVDVMVSHPKLVATGFDLFNFRKGNHNFNHIIFGQTGYDLFTLRQASGRALRIGQPKDCTLDYLYYKGTMQERAMLLMGRKTIAAEQLEGGNVSAEGLASMGGGGDQMALINSLSEVVDSNEIMRNWSRTEGGTRKQIAIPDLVDEDDEGDGQAGEALERAKLVGPDQPDNSGVFPEESTGQACPPAPKAIQPESDPFAEVKLFDGTESDDDGDAWDWDADDDPTVASGPDGDKKSGEDIDEDEWDWD